MRERGVNEINPEIVLEMKLIYTRVLLSYNNLHVRSLCFFCSSLHLTTTFFRAIKLSTQSFRSALALRRPPTFIVPLENVHSYTPHATQTTLKAGHKWKETIYFLLRHIRV